MRWFKVFNFETVVGLLVFGLMALMTPVAYAVDSPSVTDQFLKNLAPDPWLAKAEYYHCGDDTVPAKNAAVCKTINSHMSDELDESCTNADSDFKKSMDDLSDACGKVGMSKGSCRKELAKCEGTNSEKHHKHGRSGGDGDPLDADGVSRQCPAMAATDEEKYEKQLKEQQEKVDKLKKDLPDLEEKRDKFVSEKNDKVNEINDQMPKDAAEHSKELSQIGKSRDAATKGLSDQVAQLQAEISKSNDQISQTSLTKLKGALDMKTAKTQADLNCHAQATASVQKLQDQAMAQIQAGTYVRGDFSHFMRNIGVSDRAQWQRLALKYYNWCRASKPTIDSKIAADDGYTLVVQQSNAAVNSLKDHISQVQSQMANVSCQPLPGATADNQCQQALRQAQQDMQQSEADYKSKHDAAVQKIQSIANQADQQRARMDKEISDKKTEVNNENHRLDKLQEFLDAKYERGGNSNVDPKDLQGALEKLSRAEDNANQVISCDRIKAQANASIGPNQDFCTSSLNAGCSSAKRLLLDTKYKVTHPEVPDEYTDTIKSSPIDPTPAPEVRAPAQAPAADGTGQGQREGNGP
jgi:myosin heavy subunit